MTTAKKPAKRNCANCTAFNPSPAANETTCLNLVSLVIHHIDEYDRPIVIHKQPYPKFRCDSHQTKAEEQAQDAAVAQFFARIGIQS